MSKFKIGDIVRHASEAKENENALSIDLRFGPKMVVLGVGHIETIDGQTDIYMVSYLTSEGHTCRNYVVAAELTE